MARKIDNWTDYRNAQAFLEFPGGSVRWRSKAELISLMSLKFRREYDRKQKILQRPKADQVAAAMRTRRYVRVAALKSRARKGRRR